MFLMVVFRDRSLISRRGGGLHNGMGGWCQVMFYHKKRGSVENKF